MPDTRKACRLAYMTSMVLSCHTESSCDSKHGTNEISLGWHCGVLRRGVHWYAERALPRTRMRKVKRTLSAVEWSS